MRLRLAALVVSGSLCFGAAPQNTVNDVCTAVMAAAGARWDDGKLAKTLHKIRLFENLDQHVMEELESRFPGPKTGEELQRLHDESQGLKEPTELPNFP